MSVVESNTFTSPTMEMMDSVSEIDNPELLLKNGIETIFESFKTTSQIYTDKITEQQKTIEELRSKLNLMKEEIEMVQRENKYYKTQNEQLKKEMESLNKMLTNIKGNITKGDPTLLLPSPVNMDDIDFANAKEGMKILQKKTKSGDELFFSYDNVATTPTDSKMRYKSLDKKINRIYCEQKNIDPKYNLLNNDGYNFKARSNSTNNYMVRHDVHSPLSTKENWVNTYDNKNRAVKDRICSSKNFDKCKKIRNGMIKKNTNITEKLQEMNLFIKKCQIYLDVKTYDKVEKILAKFKNGLISEEGLAIKIRKYLRKNNVLLKMFNNIIS